MKQAQIPTQTVVLEKIYPHSPERVWQALTDPAALAQWLLPTTFRPKAGQRFHFTRRRPNGKPQKVRCQIVELEAPHRLAYTWQAEGAAIPSLVAWTLEPVAEGVHLRLEHIGPPTGCASRSGIVSLAKGFPCFLSPVGPAGQRQDANHRHQRVMVRPVQRGRITLENAGQTVKCVAHRVAFSAHSQEVVL